nr:retrovirus-related Pol polyprotein from transposon TNT 1-94 [Tanacetum cinerariifolium]
MVKRIMTRTKFDIEKFDETNDFALWQAYSALILCLGDRVLREITKETTAAVIWKKLETLYMSMSLANRLYLKKKLYTFNMHPSKSQSEHIDEFNKLVGDLAAIDTTILDKDQALLLLTYLPSSYDNFVKTLLYGRDTLKLKDVLTTLSSRKLQKMTKAKGDGGEGLYVRGKSGQKDMKHGTYSAWSKSYGRRRRLGCYICQSEEHLKRDCPRECRVRGTCKVQIHMRDRDGSSFVLDNVRNMSFNESEEYKKTSIGSGVGTSSVQVLQGVEFEVKPQEDHMFEVEPYGNVDHVVGSQEELFNCKEDSNEAAFAVAAVEKIYENELLTFNNTVSCEAISKWKAGLKDDMDARSYICKYDIWASKGLLDKAKGNVLGMEIVMDQSGNTQRVSQSRFYNEKLVQNLLEGYSILSLEGSLLWDCDVEKNDLGMLDKFNHGLQTYRFLWILTTPWVDQSQSGYMTLTESAKEAIWLKGLAIESGFELKIVAGIVTGALSKAIPSPRFQHRLKLLRIEDF